MTKSASLNSFSSVRLHPVEVKVHPSDPALAMPARRATPHRTDAAALFTGHLASVGERIVRSGLTLDDLAIIVGVAEWFPGIFAAAYDAEGNYVWIASSMRRELGIDTSLMLGRSICDFFPHDWCSERRRLIERALQTHAPIATVEIFRGKRVEGALLPLTRSESTPLVVYVGRFGMALSPVASHIKESMESIRLVHADWGPLAALTRRELEVLRLIAKGLSNPDIARTLHRSKRAVEWHIKNLYTRLHCEQRTDLFRLGLEAGLGDIEEGHWGHMIAAVRVGSEAQPELNAHAPEIAKHDSDDAEESDSMLTAV